MEILYVGTHQLREYGISTNEENLNLSNYQ